MVAKLNNKQEPTQKSGSKDIIENGGIEIRFIGKENSLRIVRKVKPRVLKEVLELSIGSEEERNKNLVIEGDNLMSMSTLYQYHGKIDLILTDPPYNTGKDFRYNDKWNEDVNDEGLGDYVKSDDTSRHTKWMRFMFPRLQVMKRMLKSNGVLAICIDYRELFHLGKMLDEIFGEENRLGIINWQKSYSLKSTASYISSATDYVLVYAKSFEKAKTGKLEHTEIQKERFSNPDNDPKGEWRSVSSLAPTVSKNLVYGIQNPFSGQIYYPAPMRPWRWVRSRMKPLLEEWGSEYEEKDLNDGNVLGLVLKGFNLNNLENPEQDPIFQQAREKAQYIYDNKPWPRLIYLKKGLGKIQFKSYFAEVDQGISPLTWWDEEDEKPLTLEYGTASWPHQISGHSQAGTAELKARIEFEGDFVGVKPLKLFTKIFQLWGSSPKGGICFDPFAGTGTTGEVILQFNKELKAERERERERATSTDTTKSLNNNIPEEWQFILVEQGFNPKEEDKKENNWCRTLLQERLKAVITGQWADSKLHEPLGGGFRFFKLTKQVDSSTILEMEKQELIETILSSNLNHTSLPNNVYLIAKNKQNEGIYLVWNSNGNKRESKVTEEIYRQCSLERKNYELEPIYHIYARTVTYQSPTINFHKIPDKVLIDFGIDPDIDTFINKEE